jgi:hypothetical protein
VFGRFAKFKNLLPATNASKEGIWIFLQVHNHLLTVEIVLREAQAVRYPSILPACHPSSTGIMTSRPAQRSMKCTLFPEPAFMLGMVGGLWPCHPAS